MPVIINILLLLFAVFGIHFKSPFLLVDSSYTDHIFLLLCLPDSFLLDASHYTFYLVCYAILCTFTYSSFLLWAQWSQLKTDWSSCSGLPKSSAPSGPLQETAGHCLHSASLNPRALFTQWAGKSWAVSFISLLSALLSIWCLAIIISQYFAVCFLR